MFSLCQVSSSFIVHMGNIVRLGDAVSCGDHAAMGSPDVFANGLPITNKGTPITTGHDCFPSTVFISGWSTTVFVNNQPVALKDGTKIQTHCCGPSCHDGVAITSSLDVGIEDAA